MRSFFEGIPIALEEAAFIDGANEIVIFFKIMLPLAKAAIATVGLFYGVYTVSYTHLDVYKRQGL